ncbi:MAG TPA: allophanate hydrolase subunit 1 [Nocardioidaceae bacterium]|nr:allophanate hydrolase subunit 1 [Nocardioidaceae bacterium]
MSAELTILPVGAEALLVELGSRDRAAAAYRVARELVDRNPSAARDVVPAATTVLLDGVTDPGAVRAALTAEAVEAAMRRSDEMVTSTPVVIGVRYDGADLGAVAEAWECSVEDVVERHASTIFTVAFCGFAPGFGYCVGDPPLPVVPRRADPRPQVPAGSVALAAEYCGVYPRAMPGGWQLIGTTDVVLFDASRDRPALLVPATSIRFEPVR